MHFRDSFPTAPLPRAARTGRALPQPRAAPRRPSAQIGVHSDPAPNRARRLLPLPPPESPKSRLPWARFPVSAASDTKRPLVETPAPRARRRRPRAPLAVSSAEAAVRKTLAQDPSSGRRGSRASRCSCFQGCGAPRATRDQTTTSDHRSAEPELPIFTKLLF